jgi:hypothetical protein
MSDPDLHQQAIDALNSGNRATAARLLAKVVAQDPRDEAAWLWLAACLDDLDKKRYCLRKVLEINPENETVRQDLSRLETNPPAPAPVVPVINLPEAMQKPVVAPDAAATQAPAANPAPVNEKPAKPTHKARFSTLQIIILVLLVLAVLAAIAVLVLLITSSTLKIPGFTHLSLGVFL